MKRTKIVASVSDRRCEVDFLKELYAAGMNVVRMNTAHATPEGLCKIIENVRAVSSQIGILIDTKGPEVRTTTCEGDLVYITGERVKMIGNPDGITTHDLICASYPLFVKDVPMSSHVLFDDGELDFEVIEKTDEYLLLEAKNDGKLGARKSVNVPGVRINLPALTEKDKRNIVLACEQNIDFIAHSFVRNRRDVEAVQEILDLHQSDIKIIAKIENQEGVDNIDEILEVAYGVMIARGDLGIEIPLERIPSIQKMLINKCIQAKRPVIVATQMLHSMINNPRPTRAEVTDVANAIYYHTDAVMLSGETAYGKYPVEAVRTMAAVAADAEKNSSLGNEIRLPLSREEDITEFLAKQAVKATQKMSIRAIVTDSYTGRTARFVAAFRAEIPVLAICYREKTMRMLSLSYGVKPIYLEEKGSARAYFFAALYLLLHENMITETDRVAYLSGCFGEGGGTSFLELNEVSNILSAAKDYMLPSFSAR
ncbi:MAG: pyruvate kinase [Bacteroidaceae bacterium]|nr:pyruvate kinase [Bacteroidaceae bacterium]MBP9637421.1 pyruvate kinase [Bacteroidaceae bacterium]